MQWRDHASMYDSKGYYALFPWNDFFLMAPPIIKSEAREVNPQHASGHKVTKIKLIVRSLHNTCSEKKKQRLDVWPDETLSDLGNTIANSLTVEEDFVPPYGNFQFQYYDSEEEDMVGIPRYSEPHYRAADFRGKQLTLVPIPPPEDPFKEEEDDKEEKDEKPPPKKKPKTRQLKQEERRKKKQKQKIKKQEPHEEEHDLESEGIIILGSQEGRPRQGRRGQHIVWMID